MNDGKDERKLVRGKDGFWALGFHSTPLVYFVYI